MKIAIGNDHAAVDMKNEIVEFLLDKGYEVENFGTDTLTSCNYPDYAKRVSEAVITNSCDCGILICGTGAGMAIAANKFKGIRAASVSDATTARLIKEHNNANIITFGARIVGAEAAKDIVDAYLNAQFLGGRHQNRIDLITQLEEAK